MKFEIPNTISYKPKDWLCDLLPIKEGVTTGDGELIKIPILDIQNSVTGLNSIDRVFALDQNVLVAISLKMRTIITWQYTQPYKVYQILHVENSGEWLDVACSIKNISGLRINPARPNNFSYSIVVLAEKDTILKFSINSFSFKISTEYKVSLDRAQNNTKILLQNRFSQYPPYYAPYYDAIYLWAPEKRMLREFNINYETIRGGDTEVQLKQVKEIKIRRPQNTDNPMSSEFDYDPYNTSLCLDEKDNSVVCADRTNHIIFECSLKNSESEIICGNGLSGCSEENMDTSEALIDSPCNPVVLRPLDYIPKDLFGAYAKGVFDAGKNMKKPRLILFCDSGNNAVRKIWQFPACPQARDLSRINRIYTLLGDKGHDDARELLSTQCNSPTALFLGLQGRLTVKTKEYIYIITAGVVLTEEKNAKSSISGDS